MIKSLLIKLSIVAGFWLGLSFVAQVASAQTIELRDGTVVMQEIIEFNIDGVRVAGQDDAISWDRIHKSSLAESDREFQQYLAEVGDPLMRIRLRLSNQDDSNLLELAKPLLTKLGGRETECELVAATGVLFGLIREGKREAAATVLIRCWMLERRLGRSAAEITGRSIDVNESRTWNGLQPVWFDRKSAEQEWAQISNGLLGSVSKMKARELIYVASLAAVAGKLSGQSDLLERLRDAAPAWSKIIQSQQSIAISEYGRVGQTLPTKIDDLESPLRAAALYYKGLAGIRSDDAVEKQTAILDLLQVPATIGQENPELSGACLFNVIDSNVLDSNPSSIESLRKELLEDYADTYFARILREAAKSANGELQSRSDR